MKDRPTNPRSSNLTFSSAEFYTRYCSRQCTCRSPELAASSKMGTGEVYGLDQPPIAPRPIWPDEAAPSGSPCRGPPSLPSAALRPPTSFILGTVEARTISAPAQADHHDDGRSLVA